MSGKVPITPGGIARLKDELKRLKTVERMKNVRDIEEARAHGDLSENAEYHAAKERQGMLDARMRDIEDRIARAQVIDPAALSGEKVMFGATVKLYDVDNEEEVVYAIVGDEEADLKKGRIGINSPIAKGLVGRTLDDEVSIQTPRGRRQYEIVDVRYVHIEIEIETEGAA